MWPSGRVQVQSPSPADVAGHLVQLFPGHTCSGVPAPGVQPLEGVAGRGRRQTPVLQAGGLKLTPVLADMWTARNPKAKSTSAPHRPIPVRATASQ